MQNDLKYAKISELCGINGYFAKKNSPAGKQIHTVLWRGEGTIKLLVRIYSPAKSLRQNRLFFFQFPLFCQPFTINIKNPKTYFAVQPTGNP